MTCRKDHDETGDKEVANGQGDDEQVSHFTQRPAKQAVKSDDII